MRSSNLLGGPFLRHRAWFRIACLLAALPLSSAGVLCAQPPARSPLLVTEKDNGKSVQRMIGQTLAIQLPSNPSTGYTWEVQRLKGPILEGGRRYIPAGSHTPGAGGVESMEFHAQETGTEAITLYYRRSWEHDPPARTFTLTVKIIPCGKK